MKQTIAAIQPVSGTKKAFSGSDKWLHELSRKDLFAVRTGVLKFRGFVLRRSRIPFTPTVPLTDGDFEAKFEQKGVDMRIGLDIATLSANRSIDLITLVTNDTDCIPAMKHTRRAALQIALVVVPGYHPAPELLAHSDFRSISRGLPDQHHAPGKWCGGTVLFRESVTTKNQPFGINSTDRNWPVTRSIPVSATNAIAEFPRPIQP